MAVKAWFRHLFEPEGLRQTPLHMACKMGLVRLVAWYCGQGHDLNAPDAKGRTPLHRAAANGWANVVLYLRDAGADVNIRNHKGETALHLATAKGHSDVLGLLACYVRDIDVQDMDGRSVLHIAASAGSKDVEYLVDLLADCDLVDKWGMLPLECAVKEGHLELAQYLCHWRNPQQILWTSCREGRTVVLDHLDHSFISQTRFSNGFSTMHVAAKYGQTWTVAYLYQKMGLVEWEDMEGRSPLHVAAMEGQVGVVKLLLHLGASSCPGDKKKRTPLHLAAKEGHEGVVHFLANETSVNLQDSAGDFPVHLAVKRGHTNIALFLIQHMQHPSLREGITSDVAHLHWNLLFQLRALAIKFNHLYTLDMLLYLDELPGHKGWGELIYMACANGRDQMVPMLLAKGFDPMWEDSEKQIGLHVAIRKGFRQTVEVLVQHPSARDMMDHTGLYGWDALHIATKYKNLDIVRLLCDNGADIFSIDSEGINCLHLAVMSGGSQSLVQALIDYGIRIRDRDSIGRNTLDLALDYRNWRAAKALIRAEKYKYGALRMGALQVSYLPEMHAREFVDNYGGKNVSVLINYKEITMQLVILLINYCLLKLLFKCLLTSDCFRISA